MTSTSHSKIIGIDPGKNGGLVIAASYEVDVNYVLPQKWMAHFECPKGMQVTQRKNWLKDKAKEYYPELKKVTLATADAILIARYGKDITTNR